MKFNYKNWAVFVLIALFFLHTGYYFTLYHPLNIIDLIVFETPLKNDEKIAFLTLIIALFGGGWGLFSYLRIRKSELNNFLKIFVEVEEIGNEIYIKTKVDNPINRYKYIKSAFLIINYANEQPNESFKQNISTFLGVVNLKNTNELIAIANQKKRVCCKNAFIPLPYFYDENIRVGNEFLTYIYVLNRNECNLLLSGIYEVRFFVFSKEGHLHRSVQSAFRLNGSSNQRVCDKCEIKFKNLKPVSGTSKKVI